MNQTEIIDFLIEKAGGTAQLLSKVTGISNVRISEWKNNRAKMSLNIAIDMCKKSGFELTDLKKEIEKENPLK